ncbi:cytochrome-c peroxidase [Hyphomicrobium nitrativorans]|uniref:cytochrome-c peroxidase n=1 Tax=Hyphomicrobium nitrativorans TaxID=1427356 RepID=UPI000A42EC2F|nr:cytochrome c peroxidase [Hyphomicrobium nitrativorans]
MSRLTAALAVGLVVALAAGGGLSFRDATATAGPAASPGRDAVWRTIFARPASAPQSAPSTPAQIALGHDLFHDPRLSGNGSASCATCHQPERAFTDGRPKGQGLDGSTLPRNVPGLYDLAWGTSFFWDGRAPTLAAQARFPILAEDEMAGDFPTILQRLGADADMTSRIAAAFPGSGGVTEEAILAALATYVGSLASPAARFDRWIEGDDGALDAEERQGFALFVGKAGCVSCHGGWRLTDDGFHDIGLAGDDLGRDGRRQFKTPSLREAVHTAPYMHDGSLATLDDVVEHYTGRLIVRPSLAPTVVRDLTLSESEKAALVAFLRTLSSEKTITTP